MPGPLHGVQVLDFTQIIAGPLGGRLLADMGADVIKLEPPWGEPWRFQQKFLPSESRNFIVYNRGKRSLPLDLSKPEAKEIIHRLIKRADVTLMNFRPDVAANLGVDYDTLAEINPRLIYCEITAYGREGPDANRPGYDMILQAMSGLMASEAKIQDGVPQQIFASALIDTTSGVNLSSCVCAALYAREKTGVGQRVETSLLGSALTLLGSRFLNVDSYDLETRKKALADIASKRAESAPYSDQLDASPGSRRQRHHANVYYRIYMTQDRPIGVGCLSDPLRRRLLDTLGLEDIAFEPGYDPNAPESVAYAERLTKQAENLFREKSSTEWFQILEERGIPTGPVRFVEELFDDAQIRANGLVSQSKHRDAGTVTMIGPTAKFRGTPAEPALPSPALGEHTAEIMLELGYTNKDYEAWKESGIVS